MKIKKYNKEQDIHIQYFKQNPVGSLYKRIGFELDVETEFHFRMIKPKSIKENNLGV